MGTSRGIFHLFNHFRVSYNDRNRSMPNTGTNSFSGSHKGSGRPNIWLICWSSSRAVITRMHQKWMSLSTNQHPYGMLALHVAA